MKNLNFSIPEEKVTVTTSNEEESDEEEKHNYELYKKSIASLLNYEGRIATFYWEQLSKVFKRARFRISFQK